MNYKSNTVAPLEEDPKNGQAENGQAGSSDARNENPLDSYSLSLITSMSARIGAEAALEAAERKREEQRMEAIDRRYQDTKLLLQHYRTLNKHYSHAVWENVGEDGEEYSLSVLNDIMKHRDDNSQVFVDSIKEAAEQTRTIMQHLNTMLGIYQRMCEESGRPEDRRRWRVLRRMYLDPRKIEVEGIAEIEHVGKRTIFRDLNIAVEELTALLFGVAAMDRLNETNKDELLETAKRNEKFRDDPEKFLQSLEEILPEE